jgi:cyclohexanecarboxyl-CoA dehydrogenase
MGEIRCGRLGASAFPAVPCPGSSGPEEALTRTVLPPPPDPLREEVAALDQRLHLEQRSRARDVAPAFPKEEFQALGRAHLLGLTVPPSVGGRGVGLLRGAGALFELAYRGGTMWAKLALQPEFCSLLSREGTSDLRRRYFSPLIAGDLLIGNQVTEPGAGSDAASLATTAMRAGDDYHLDGTKTQVAFAQDAELAIVYARTGPAGSGAAGISAFVVDQGTAGIERKVLPDYGERWMRRGTVTYHDVRVPRSRRLGAEGRAFEILKAELARERALLGAIYLGVAWASWEETVKYAEGRMTFDRPLSDREAIAFPLVEDQVRLTAAWTYLERVLGRMDLGAPAEGEAALAKWYCADVALGAVDHALHFHGGQGYSEELPYAQRYRDLRSARIAHGTDEIMHLVAARELWPRPPRPPAAKG